MRLAIFLLAAAAWAQAQSTANLVQVPVVVRDRDGHAVQRLLKEAFELYDRGKRQQIVSFAETRLGEQTVPARQVALLFDDVGIRDSADVTRVRNAAARHLAALQPGERASIASTTCRVLLDFTEDRAKLQEAVSRISFGSPPVCRVARKEVLQLSVLSSLVRQVALAPGQRGVILISRGFYVGHDRTAEMTQLIDQAIGSKVRIDALDVGGVSGSPTIETTHPFSPGPPDTVTRQTGGQQLQQVPPSHPVALIELTSGTGGTYVAAGNDLDVGFRSLATPESFYLLGFAPGGAQAGAGFHELKVKVKDPRQLAVQARIGYAAGARKQE